MKRLATLVMMVLVGAGCAADAADEGDYALEDPGEESVAEAEQALYLYDYSASNTNSAANEANVKKKSISIGAGETVMIGTTVLPGTLFKGDTYLRLYNFLDKQVAYNDDAACNLNAGSLISFTSPYGTTESFELWGGCYGNDACGPNTVQIARRDPVVFSYSGQDTNNGTVNTTNKTYALKANQNVRISTCSYAAHGAKAIGDTVLRLYREIDGAWVHVAANGNTSACEGQCDLASLIQYTVPATGNYQVRAGCADAEECSGTVVLYRQ
ncbi:hypothetical protein [Polyangium mundeleinium]|uniref:Uncharacterized protein n=1 Tax=Polyangium mundeleinium TaxID=2995306 RepID=A0ABT5EWB5_9BACT|nr:hypothetical protein [Polyangium mundeleinium]MDC0746102.1 hypothetical protein [Polyangium mundeleinium]